MHASSTTTTVGGGRLVLALLGLTQFREAAGPPGIGDSW
jgi:hypothetical protein